MAQIKPKYKMSLNEAIASRMTEEAFEAYLNLHEISISKPRPGDD